MTVLDASALIGFLRDEPCRVEVEELLRRRPPPSISAVNVTEVVDRLVRLDGRDPAEVNDVLDLLIVGGLEIQPFWLPNSRRAAALRSSYYHRTRSAISLADAAALATAIALQTDIATTDSVLADAAVDAGVSVVKLPGSAGA